MVVVIADFGQQIKQFMTGYSIRPDQGDKLVTDAMLH